MKLPKFTRRRAFALAVLVAVALVLSVIARPRPVPVDVSAVDRGPMREALTEEGRTHLRVRTVLVAPAVGHLQLHGLRAGDRIGREDVIARVTAAAPPPTDAAVRAELSALVRAAAADVQRAHAEADGARAAHDLARMEAHRLERLGAAGAVAGAMVDDALGALAAAEARRTAAVATQQAAEEHLARARASLDRAVGTVLDGGTPLLVRAPWSGVVLSVLREHDGVVAAGEPLVQIGDLSSLEVVVPVLTADAAALPPGTSTVVSDWGGPPLLGRVRHVEPRAFTRVSALGVEEQRTNVVVDVDVPPEMPALGDALAVEVSLERWRAQDVVRVPSGALFRHGPAWGAFVLDDGRARQRQVLVGHRTLEMVEVLEGLAPGDRVILYPSERIDEGVRVREREERVGPSPP